jgi:hypothetical protein
MYYFVGGGTVVKFDFSRSVLNLGQEVEFVSVLPL